MIGREENIPCSSSLLKSHFVEMGFSQALVDRVLEENGEANDDLLLEALLGHSALEKSIIDEDVGRCSTSYMEELNSTDNIKFYDDQLIKEADAEILHMEETKILLEMGFKDDEIFDAIDIFGHVASITELADSIFANRLARGVDDDQKEDSLEHRNKKSKYMSVDGNQAFCSRNEEEEDLHIDHKAWQSQRSSCNRSNSSTEARENQSKLTTPSIQHTSLLSRPPYLFYGSIIDLPEETWRKLSQLLHGIEPEFVNAKFFSPLVRKEGYLHTLPKSNRARIFPESPMTIVEALPHTKSCWPPWDSRKQLSFVPSDSSEAVLLCEKLGELLSSSLGMPSKEQESYILHHCKKMNLLWVAENKLCPIEPNQLERILGYPDHHTELFGLEPDARLKKLMDSFQIDTLAYHLSPLRSMYPEGIRLLSVHTGIGGAEIALHRIGIHLKFVVSVENDEVNQRIMNRWWQRTGQTGQLLQIESVEKLTAKKLWSIVEKIGGIDIAVGGTTLVYRKAKLEGSLGIDMSLFFEFARIFQQVRRVTERM